MKETIFWKVVSYSTEITIDEKLEKVKNTAICEAVFYSEVEKKMLSVHPETEKLRIYPRDKVREIVNPLEALSSKHSYTVVLGCHVIDDRGKEKVMKYDWVLFANDVTDAKRKAEEYLKQGYDDFYIITIKESDYNEVI